MTTELRYRCYHDYGAQIQVLPWAQSLATGATMTTELRYRCYHGSCTGSSGLRLVKKKTSHKDLEVLIMIYR